MVPHSKADMLFRLFPSFLQARTCKSFRHSRAFSFAAVVLFILALLSCAVRLPAAEPDPAIKKAPDSPDTNLDDLLKMEIPTVYGASKQKQKVTEAPSSVTIISSDEVKKYGYRTLADILQSVQGLQVTSDRNYSFLGVRGFNRRLYPNSNVLILVDGHRINNNLYDGASIGTDFILDVDLIDHVEIIRGAGSVLYGNNAFFGVINVITRKGSDLLGAEISGAAASYDTYNGRVTYGNKFKNGLGIMLSGSFYDSGGRDRLFYKEFNSPANNNGVAQGMDHDGFKSIFGNLTYKDFTLQGGFVTRDKVNPTAQFASTVFNDPRLSTLDDRGYVTLKYEHEFTDVVDVTAQVYYDRSEITSRYPSFVVLSPVNPKDPPTTNSLPLFVDVGTGEWWGMELQLKKQLFDRHSVSLGGEYRNDFRQERRSFFMDGTGSTKSSRSSQSYGIYLQGDFALLTPLHLSAGARYDQYGNSDPAANPRLALIYNPVESSVFKAIYGTAFRAPTFIELSNPFSKNLVPETITTYEAVYEQGIGSHLRSSLSAFYNQGSSRCRVGEFSAF